MGSFDEGDVFMVNRNSMTSSRESDEFGNPLNGKRSSIGSGGGGEGGGGVGGGGRGSARRDSTEDLEKMQVGRVVTQTAPDQHHQQ